MPLRKLEQERRLAICSLAIELMAPVEGTVGLSVVDNLVLCAAAVSSFGPHRLSAHKIADTTGIALTTVRRSLKKLVALGRITLDGAHYIVAPDYSAEAYRVYDIKRKGKAIRQAANRLNKLREGAPERRPVGVDASVTDCETLSQANGLAQGSR